MLIESDSSSALARYCHSLRQVLESNPFPHLLSLSSLNQNQQEFISTVFHAYAKGFAVLRGAPTPDAAFNSAQLAFFQSTYLPSFKSILSIAHKHPILPDTWTACSELAIVLLATPPCGSIYLSFLPSFSRANWDQSNQQTPWYYILIYLSSRNPCGDGCVWATSPPSQSLASWPPLLPFCPQFRIIGRYIRQTFTDIAITNISCSVGNARIDLGRLAGVGGHWDFNFVRPLAGAWRIYEKMDYLR